MKNIIIGLSLMFIIPMFSCSSSKDISERRSLMMPRLSEVPRNRSKFKEIDHSQRKKYQAKKAKKRSRDVAYGRR